jgi:hypothetical protein
MDEETRDFPRDRHTAHKRYSGKEKRDTTKWYGQKRAGRTQLEWVGEERRIHRKKRDRQKELVACYDLLDKDKVLEGGGAASQLRCTTTDERSTQWKIWYVPRERNSENYHQRPDGVRDIQKLTERFSFFCRELSGRR